MRSRWMLLALTALFAPTVANAQPTPQSQPSLAGLISNENGGASIRKREASQFVRVINNEQGQPVALQTATIRYKLPGSGTGNGGDFYVDLVGVIHIADALYYASLNDQFKQYDAVLYELVAPEGKEVPKPGEEPKNILTMLQKIMKLALDLEFQKDAIDYTRPNFVHADLSPDEMLQKMQKRGDNAITLSLSVATDILRWYNRYRQDPSSVEAPGVEAWEEVNWKEAIMEPAILKRAMAVQLAEVGAGDSLGATVEKILIQDRNEAAMEVFEQQVLQGKRQIGVFYGAAHMPDFEARLRRDYGMVVDTVSWQTAWDLRNRGRSMQQINEVINTIKNMFDN